MFILPKKTKRFIQNNRSDLLGDFWSTKNIDLQTNMGRLMIGQKLVSVVTDADDADLIGAASAFEFFDGRWWATLAGGRIAKNTSEQLTGSWSEDTSTNAITTYSEKSDLKTFNSRLWATATGKLMSKATGSGTGSWTDRTGSANLNGLLCKLAYLRKFDRLYWVEGNSKIASIDKSDTMALSGDYFLDIAATSDLDGISAMDAGFDRVWIALGVYDNNASSSGGRKASILEWDGISNQITKEYKIDAAQVMAIKVDPTTDIPYAFDSEGRLLKYTGYGFQEVSRLPCDRKRLIGASATLNTTTFIKPNGMVFTKDHTVLCLINNQNDDAGSTINENLPSGIWEFELGGDHPSVSHRYSFTLGVEGTAGVTDFGQNRISDGGALAMNPFAMSGSAGSCYLVCGAVVNSSNSSTISGIYVDAPNNANTDNEGQKAGYFVTDWLETGDTTVSDTWQKAFLMGKKLTSGDKIILKYRTNRSAPVEISITWVDTTTFTTATNISSYVGYEVEGISGTGAGGCGHISTVTGPSGGLYTATLNQAFTGVTTGTAKARLQNWKWASETTNTYKEDHELNAGLDSSPRVQFKVFFLVTGDWEFHRMKVINASDQLAK